MPDFDKDLIAPVNLPTEDVREPQVRAYTPAELSSGGTTLAHTPDIFDKLNAASRSSRYDKVGPFVTQAELEANQRYTAFNPTIDNQEDFAAYGQGTIEKAVNGILKGANLAATTVAGGFGMLGGAIAAPFTGKLSTIWDNPVMNALDEWNNKVDQQYLPNYYTDVEKNANWYSPDNWMKANFIFDKFIKNAGFAVGAMYSGNIANAFLKGAGSVLGGLAAEGAIAAEASQSFKLFTPLLRNTARAFSRAQNIEMAAMLEKNIGSIADLNAVNSEIANIARTTNRFAKIGDEVRRTAIAAYSTAGEASFEALQTSKEYRNKLIEDYKAANGGLEPTGEDLEAIDKSTRDVGAASFLGNLAILGVTEYFQLNKLLGSTYSAEKQAANSIMGQVNETVMKDGVLVAAEATTKFGKLYDKVVGIGKYFVDPKESLQEGAQYALQVGSQNYYAKAFRGQDAQLLVDGVLHGLYGKNEKGEGVGVFNSKEGGESMLLGAFTGGGMQALGTYKMDKALAANTDRFLNEIKNAPTYRDAFIDRTNSINRDVQLEKEYSDAVRSGDKLEAKDLKADKMHNYLSTRIKYGRFDLIMEDIADLRRLSSTEQGLSNLKEEGVAGINDDIQSFQQRLNNFEQVAKNTDEIYRSLDLRYSGVMTEDGKRKYSNQTIDKLAYASSKIYNYDQRIPQVNQSLIDAGVPTFDILNSIIEEGVPNKKATEEAVDFINKSKTINNDTKKDLKTNLSHVIEMSLRRNAFIEEYNNISNDPLEYELPEYTEITDPLARVKQAISPEERAMGKRATNKDLEVGKEYSLAEPVRREGNTINLAPKIKVLAKTLGGEYEVRLPNGTTKFMKPIDFKDYNVIESSNESEDFANILYKAIKTVLRKPQHQGLQAPEGQDVIEWVNSLNNKALIDDIERVFATRATAFMKEMAKSQFKREQLLNNQGDIEEGQSDLEAGSGEFPTGTEPDESIDPEKKRKPTPMLFTSTTLPSADSLKTSEEKLPGYVIRYNTFINKVRTFANRANLKSMLVTAKDLTNYGLDGLLQINYGKPLNHKFTDAEMQQYTSDDKGFVASVFVEQEGTKLHFLDANGNRIGTVGEKIDVSKVVFATMPTDDLTWKDGKTPRYRAGQLSEAERYQKGWLKYRKDLFANPYDGTNSIPLFTFGISRGFRVSIPGKAQRNGVGEVLELDDAALAQPGLVQISTLGTITHTDGESYKFAKGRTVLTFGDVLEYLQNSRFTAKQAKSIFEVLKGFSAAVKSDLEAKRKVQLKNKYTQYLQNVLFWKKSDNPSANQIFLDEATGKLYIGKNSYDLIDIDKLENEIVSDLQQVSFSANNSTLEANQKFYELYYEGGELKEREWKNYQQFLLASKNPDGSKRDIPLTLDVSVPTPSVPYAFTQKYAYLNVPLSLPAATTPAAPTLTNLPTPVGTPQAVVPTALTYNSPNQDIVEAMLTKIVDGRILSGQLTPSIGLAQSVDTSEGPVQFILEENGPRFLASQNLANLVANEDKVNAMRAQLGLTPSAAPVAAPVQVAPTQAPAPAVVTPVKNTPKGTLTKFSILGRDNRFNPTNANPSEKNVHYGVDEEGDVFMIAPESKLPTMLYDFKAYIGGLYDVTVPQDMKMADGKGVSITELPKVDSQGNLIKKGKLTYTDTQTITYDIQPVGSTVPTTPEAPVTPSGQQPMPTVISTQPEGGNKLKGRKNSFTGNRKVGEQDKRGRMMTEKDVEFFKNWAAKYLPKMPYEYLANMIQVTGGGEAWGRMVNGAVQVVEGGLVGTDFHEAMEYVWKGFLSPEQQQALLDEFRSQKGTFVDRESGNTYAYNDPAVTDLMAKERIMDNFADYMVDKLPAKNLKEKVLKFFKAIVDFVKNLFKNTSLQRKLFNDINTGKFAEMAFPESRKDDIIEYSRVAGINSQLAYEYVEDIKASFYQGMYATNQSLFDISEKNANAIFDQIVSDYKDSGIVLSDGQFKDLIQLAKESLRSDNFDFEDDNTFSINTEGVTNRNYAADAFTVDFKKSAPYAVKIAIGSLVKTVGYDPTTGFVEYDYSPNLGGMMLLPSNQVYVTLTNKLANTRDVNDFIAKLHDLAKSNSDYVDLFRRLGGDMKSGKVDFSKMNLDGMRLFSSFMQTFTKQAPEILVQYLRDNNRYTSAANLSKVSQVVEDRWIANMLTIAGVKNSIITYDKANKQYIVNPETKLAQPNKETQLDFLKALGVDFDQKSYNRLSEDQQTEFGEAVQRVYTDITTDKVLKLRKEKGQFTRTIGGGLIKLAELFASVNSVNYSSVLYNAEGKQQQAYTDANAPSLFEYYFNSAKTLDELLKNMPQLNDVNSRGSQLLKKGGKFFDINGKRTKAKLLVKTINGEINVNTDKGVSVTDFNIGTRTVTEINQNINGNYYILIPADGSTEWMMGMGNVIDYQDFTTGRWEDAIKDIFKGYLIDDIKLARDSANRTKLANMKGKEKQLRFFEGFLSQPNARNKEANRNALTKINNLIAKKSATNAEITALVNELGDVVRDAVVDYIEASSKKTITELTKNRNILDFGDGTFSMSGLDNNFASKKGVRLNKEALSKEELENVINYTTANYVINNIEYFKVLFGDPFQFEVKTKKNKVVLDITKRIKSFLSPRRITINFNELNNLYNNARNTVGGIKLQPGDVGYHEYKDFARTFTAKNMIVTGKFYSVLGIEETDEADAASWLMPGAYREIKDKNGQWSNEAEAFHQWQMAYARQKMSAKGTYTYKNNDLKAHDAALINTPRPEYVIDVLKPIVTGNKYNKKYIDLVLDKFSQLPLYYEAIEGTNLEELFTKMHNEGFDYVVVRSGRKVGAETENLHPLYKPNGKFNDAAVTSSVDVPWSAYGIQVENSYNKPKGQRLGSQPTKIVTSDMYENGVAVSPEAEEAVKEHTEALRALYRNGFDNLLYELGIKDEGNRFTIEDKTPLSITLRKEMLKQAMSDNALASITINPDTKDFEIPFEASTNYVQIKRIIYSMVEKRIYSPTVNGNSAVQVPVTMWESSGKGRGLLRKIGEKKYEPITTEAYEKLSDDDKADVVLTDETLKFYQDADGLRYCEIKVPFPTHLQGLFDRKFPNMDEKEKMEKILKYLNDNAEEALFGVGFRIPTQSLNSIERFKIAGFLPSFMGNTVVVPSEITTKAGSDFDIDKLNMYMKSMYLDSDGEIKVFKLQGDEEATKEYYGQVFDRLIQNEQDYIVNKLLKDNDFIDTDYEQTLSDKLNKLEEKKATREDFVRKAYRNALENRYYTAIDNILSMEDNFERLTDVNTNENLIELSEEMDGLRGDNESNIINRVLDRNYMTGQRQSFVMGKAWVGIVAQHITGHSNGQKAGLYVNDENFTMSLPHNKLGKYVSVSGLYDSEGRYISQNLSEYINAIVDIAKDPYIMKLIYSGQIVDIVMFLARSGVSPRNTALFLSQPIIRSFVEGADNSNKKINSLLANSDAIMEQLDSFGTSYTAKQSAGDVFDVSKLSDHIKSYAEDQNGLSDQENAQQQLIFKEFIQIVRAANGLSEITQSTNFDTTSFRSAEQLTRKKLKVEQQGLDPDVIPISSSVAVLENTHIGTLEEVLDDANIALGAIFKFNAPDFREFIDSMINKYGINKYLSKDKYNKISEQLSASLLDYIIQSNRNMFVKQLTSGPNSVAVKLERAKAANPNLQILQDLQIVPGRTKDAPSTIKLGVSKLDAAEENMYTNMMRGLRDEASTRELYEDLVKLSIVQGTYRTSASIKNIIPIEDYAGIVTDLVKNINVDDSVKKFKEYAFFQRNNFRDTNIVPEVSLYAKAMETEMSIDEFTGDIINKYFFPSIINKQLGRTVLRINKQFTKGAGAELIVIPATIDVGGDKVNFATGLSITPADFARASKQEDNPFKYVFGYQLVKNPLTGQPLMIQTNPKYAPDYVYKIVNLYGDGRFTTEYPGFPVPSQLENGTIKVNREYTDDEVLAMLTGQTISQSVSETPVVEGSSTTPETFQELTPEPQGVDPFAPAATPVAPAPQPIQTQTSPETINIYAGTGENAELSNFANRPFTVKGITFPTVEHAFQYAKTKFYNTYGIDPSSDATPDQLQKIVDAHGQAILNAKTAAEAKALGRKAIGVEFEDYAWDKESSKIMKTLIKISFNQNPDALAKLLATGNATLTHTQDKGKWGTEFPKLLMEVRDELRSTTQPTQATSTTAKEKVEEIVTAPGYIKDSAKKHLAKELFKIRQATQFIGTGGGNDSTTTRMQNAYSQVGLANTGVYSADDLIYVSSNGARGNRFVNVKNGILQGVYTLIDKAIAANARFIMDTKSHLDATAGYNVGEVDMANYLTSKGYTREDATGIWSPSQAPVVEAPVENIVEYGGKKFIIEGTPEGGNLTAFFAKNDGTRGAELTSDKPLYRKVAIATYAQDHPENIVELTDLQGSPKYLFVPTTGKVVSLNPTSYGDEIVSGDVVSRVKAKFETGVAPVTPKGTQETKSSTTFSYNNKTIDTDFALTDQQDKALKRLIDFANSKDQGVITLAGYAGTGKTSTIGYLEKFLGTGFKLHYMAPTHAATVELAFATVKTGNRTLPMTVAKAIKSSKDFTTGIETKEFSREMTKRLALGKNIIVLDEVSMLNNKDYAALLQVAQQNNIKIIFMGDPAQIPEVDATNPDKKQISKAFSDHEQITLTEIKRTSDDDILQVLTAVRNNINNKIPKVANTDNLKYLPVSQFNALMAETVNEDPENSVLIAYTNNAATLYNQKIRESLGRTGDLQSGDVIVGFGGYNSKQIEAKNIANSVRYTVSDVEKDGSEIKIIATSSRLKALEELGVARVSERASGRYLQLRNDDALTFSELSQDDFNKNNRKVSDVMKQVYDLKAIALRTSQPRDWARFYELLDNVRGFFSTNNLGGDYIYNPTTDSMEKFDYMIHGELAKQFYELIVEKGVDFGHAVTIHKSQGSTIKNVFFDANSLPSSTTSKLYRGNDFVGTEKQSLIYVGMSRASNLLVVSDDISENFYNLKDYDSSQNLTGEFVNEQSYRMHNGEVYKASEITVELLEKMGYSAEVIGTFLKQLNGC